MPVHDLNTDHIHGKYKHDTCHPNNTFSFELEILRFESFKKKNKKKNIYSK